MTLVRATIGDLERAMPLCEHFRDASPNLYFDRQYFLGMWGRWLNTGDGAVFLLRAGNDDIGVIAAAAFREPFAGRAVCQEVFWWVEPAHRGRGLGALRLYRALLRWAKSKGCVEIRMGHLTDLMPKKMNRFLRAKGFTEVERLYSRKL